MTIRYTEVRSYSELQNSLSADKHTHTIKKITRITNASTLLFILIKLVDKEKHLILSLFYSK